MMDPRDVLALFVLAVIGTLVAAALLFILSSHGVAVPTFPSERPAAVPVPVRLPFVTGVGP